MSDTVRPKQWPPTWPDVRDPLVLSAMGSVPRHLFVPPEHRADAYEDVAQPIGQGQTISQPYIVALMTQALCLRPDSRVLEIGTGSGYQAAILATITSHVWSIERRAELAEAARTRLAGLGYAVEIKVGDGCLGWPEHAPYDGIIVTAAGREVPPVLVAQMADGGRLVMPLGDSTWDQVLWLIEKQGSALRARILAEVRFVPLISDASPDWPEDEAMAAIRRQLRDLLSPWRN
jgi:protein-L-isoaspartate(D-aspartate) O-methyltransferase